MKDVVVATRPLGIGVMVKPADVKLTKVPVDAFPKGAFSKVEEVLDRPVVSNILLDEPLLEGRLAVKGSGLGLAPTIPVGMRAVTVRVNDVAGAAGFVLPGLRVDVLVTGRPPTGDSTMTTTVLQNLLVLSAGQAMQSDARGTPVSVSTVTLLVSPADAETLTLANGEGRIQLVLRNSSDEGIEKTPGRYVAELYGAPRKPAPAPVQPRPGSQAGGDGRAARGHPDRASRASSAGPDRGHPRRQEDRGSDPERQLRAPQTHATQGNDYDSHSRV